MAEEAPRTKELDDATDLRADFLDKRKIADNLAKEEKVARDAYEQAATVASGLETAQHAAYGNNRDELAMTAAAAAQRMVVDTSLEASNRTVATDKAQGKTDAALRTSKDHYQKNQDAIQEQGLEYAQGEGYVPSEAPYHLDEPQQPSA